MSTPDPEPAEIGMVTYTVRIGADVSAQLAAAAAREGASVDAFAALWLEEHADEARQRAESIIDIDTFTRMDLRVGQVLRAERVAGADRLLRLEVDLGEPVPRQILAGIAQWYGPQDLIGQKVVVIANLRPRTLHGFESRGMLLAASGEDGRPRLATVPGDTPNGSRLR